MHFHLHARPILERHWKYLDILSDFSFLSFAVYNLFGRFATVKFWLQKETSETLAWYLPMMVNDNRRYPFSPPWLNISVALTQLQTVETSSLFSLPWISNNIRYVRVHLRGYIPMRQLKSILWTTCHKVESITTVKWFTRHYIPLRSTESNVKSIMWFYGGTLLNSRSFKKRRP